MTDLTCAETYDRFYRECPVRSCVPNLWAAKGPSPEANSITDIGCGAGVLGSVIEPGVELYGIDVSDVALRTMPPEHKRAYRKLLQADLTEVSDSWKPPWSPTEMLFCCDVLEHIQEGALNRFWKAALACVQNEALALVCADSFGGGWAIPGWGLLHRTIWSPERWREWLAARIEIDTEYANEKTVAVYGRLKKQL